MGPPEPFASTPPWAVSAARAVQQLETDVERGLTAEQARRRLQQHGPNELPQPARPGLAAMAWEQLREPLVVVLLVAAAISAALGERVDAAAILAIVALNTSLGVLQQRRAEQALEALRRLLLPTARVVRDGRLQEVPAASLVPGDLVALETGGRVPADLRLVETVQLKVDESALTGESVPVEKEAATVLEPRTATADRTNMAFMGTVVTYGRGRGVVVATGQRTEVGRIAALVEAGPSEPTPLQRDLAQVGKVLGALALAVVGLVFVVGLARGEPLAEMFLTSVSLAVAAVPEGLPAVVTMVLALGVQRMARRKAIIRRLPAVETLGAATVIATDKTGTLTLNRMTVVRVWPEGAAAEWVLRAAALANDARLEVPRPPPAGAADGPAVTPDGTAGRDGGGGGEGPAAGEAHAIGDPTEVALLEAAVRHGLHPDQLQQSYPRIAELPFDSRRQRMSTVHRHLASQPPAGPPELARAAYLLFAKGSVEAVLPRCRHRLRGGRLAELDEAARQAVAEEAAAMARDALRVLAVAARPLEEAPASVREDELERDLVLLGLVGMMDPPRPEAAEAIRISRSAGLRPVMVTGDHRETAAAIAARVGLLRDGADPGRRVVSGPELEAMSDEELQQRVEEVDVFARVSPEQKLRIVRALQARGHVVAVTGDGVNDAPALRRADIGAAMGQTGTDVARGAADMVLADDHYATVVAAVAEGRTLFDNIRKFVHYLLSCNLGEVVAILGALALGLGRPLTAVQILLVNLVTDGLPALALGVDPPEPGLMRRPPRGRREGVLAGGILGRVVYQGLVLGVLALAVYALLLAGGATPDQARTATFAALALSQLVQAFNVRSARGSALGVGLWSNGWLVGAVLASAALLTAVLWWPPLGRVFDVVPLERYHWGVVAVAALAPLPLVELVKAVERAVLAPARSHGGPTGPAP